MTISRPLALLAGAVLTSLALACGDGDEAGKPATGGTPETATTTEATADSSAPGTTATAAASRTTTAEQSKAARQALLKSAENLERSRYHIVYNFEATDASGGYKGKMGLAQDDKKSLLRLEMDSAAEGRFVFSIIEDGENSFFCFGGSGADSCLKDDADAENPMADDFPLYKFEEELKRLAESGAVTVEPAADQKIGSLDAKCYTVTEAGQAGTACVAKSNGFLLLIEGVIAGDSVKLVVDTYTDKPAGSVFEPPYPVSKFGLN